MKIEKIINDLVSHEISKDEAINKLKIIAEGLMSKNAIEMEVKKVSCSVEDNHGFLELEARYMYKKIKHLSSGDVVNLIEIP